jgi:hypothetical protein
MRGKPVVQLLETMSELVEPTTYSQTVRTVSNDLVGALHGLGRPALDAQDKPELAAQRLRRTTRANRLPCRTYTLVTIPPSSHRRTDPPQVDIGACGYHSGSKPVASPAGGIGTTTGSAG